jgi:GrpB-like predicted nucleotidyltransferase (UPF0157 family)
LVTASRLGLENDQVRLVVYDARWPLLFEDEANRLREIVRDEFIKVEHIGSTAVPGLESKPIIDMMIGVRDDETRERVASRLSALGYEDKGERGIAGRTFLTRGIPVTHHLHLVVYNEGFWADHVLFRDYLRSKAEVARSYTEIKKRLASAYPDNRELYTLGKSDFITRVLEQALTEFTQH